MWISQLWNVGTTFGNQYNATYQDAKDKNNMIISIDIEKTFDNFFNLFMKNTHQARDKRKII